MCKHSQKIKPFLIEERHRAGGYSRLREQREQKHRDTQMHVHLMDITLEIGDQLGINKGKSISGTKNSMGGGLVQRGNMVNLKN